MLTRVVKDVVTVNLFGSTRCAKQCYLRIVQCTSIKKLTTFGNITVTIIVNPLTILTEALVVSVNELRLAQVLDDV